ncbi:uncharacterized protein PV07_00075 [Cladophialophora immunda]|uniref:Uncharacterized protein n=1 Tax=Cladophialophora immunda TaxID=569365 RepID=A0A0D1ZYK8_9EURO|nr:uncharacterized protein PV07_00075 [Cladophialophora immunda]KIW33206.1 hypothetical protein PV07_00075 [Cladophialophora immunda]OQU99991.1 hypothetical protein CLAIMM_05554 [Cladophialophora immunda]
MWSPSRITRTSSSHSIAMSVASMATSTSSKHSSQLGSSPETNYSENDHDSLLSSYQDDKQHQDASLPPQVQPQELPFNLEDMPLWQPKKRTLHLNSREHFLVAAKQHREVHQSLEMQRSRSESVATDDSHATLAEDASTIDQADMDLKTPTVTGLRVSDEPEEQLVGNPALPFESTGPMSDLLHSILLRVADVERSHPTIMSKDYDQLQSRITELERENQAILRNHADLLSLRNEDLSNLIKVRDLLAEERRGHAAMRKLRDEDLENVLMLRGKLAKATWSGRLQSSQPQDRRSVLGGGATTPLPQRLSRSDSDDLWQQARTAAMEQRVLELEKANTELRTQSMTAPNTGAISLASGATGGDVLLNRVETMFEDSLRHREKMATKVQQLRSEKEALQKEVATLEDRNAELEALVERLKRGVNLGH